MRRFGLAAGLVLSVSVFAGPNDPLPRKGALSAAYGPVSAEVQKSLKLKPDDGVEISRLLPGGSAEKIGFAAGDILLAVGRERVGTTRPLQTVIAKHYAGEPLEFAVLRGGKRLTLRGTLLERPRQSSPDFDTDYDQVVSQGKRIRVITTHPKGAGKYPTVFFIGGIGAYSLDGNFEGIAYGNVLGPLAKAGFATVRIDKPGQGDSEGPIYTELKFGAEMDAYRQAMKYAKALPFVDANRIGIFGHSMGGAFGPLLAAEEPVAAVAVYGTIAKTWMEYWIENVRRQGALAGASAADLDLSQKQLVAINTYLFYEKRTPADIVRRHPELKAAMAGQTGDGKTMSGVGIPFFQELADQNLVKAWSDAKCKVLTIWGENDFISTRFDHEYIADIVNQKRPGTAKFLLLEKTDHGFQVTSSLRDSQERWGRGGTHNPNIEQALIAWFRETLGS